MPSTLVGRLHVGSFPDVLMMTSLKMSPAVSLWRVCSAGSGFPPRCRWRGTRVFSVSDSSPHHTLKYAPDITQYRWIRSTRAVLSPLTKHPMPLHPPWVTTIPVYPDLSNAARTVSLLIPSASWRQRTCPGLFSINPKRTESSRSPFLRFPGYIGGRSRFPRFSVRMLSRGALV